MYAWRGAPKRVKFPRCGRTSYSYVFVVVLTKQAKPGMVDNVPHSNRVINRYTREGIVYTTTHLDTRATLFMQVKMVLPSTFGKQNETMRRRDQLYSSSVQFIWRRLLYRTSRFEFQY